MTFPPPDLILDIQERINDWMHTSLGEKHANIDTNWIYNELMKQVERKVVHGIKFDHEQLADTVVKIAKQKITAQYIMLKKYKEEGNPFLNRPFSSKQTQNKVDFSLPRGVALDEKGLKNDHDLFRTPVNLD